MPEEGDGRTDEGARPVHSCEGPPAGPEVVRAWIRIRNRAGTTGPRGVRERPQAVLFDLFHTLVDVNDVPGPTSAEILGIDPDAWRDTVFYKAAHHALGLVQDPVESVRRIAHSIDPSIPEERIVRAARTRPLRFRRALLQVRPAVLEALGRLRGSGLRLGLVSNASHDEVDAWTDSPLAPCFDTALFSCREGVMKPDPEIYLRGARNLSVDPGLCLFVGDGGSHEHDGAREAGMATVLFLGLLEESLPEVAARRPRNTDWVVYSMRELADLIELL